MKKNWLIIFIFLSSVQTPVHALDGSGEIQEVRLCHQASTWKTILFFRLSDNNWFGVYADYNQVSGADYEDNITLSFIMNLFSQNFSIDVRGSSTDNKTLCGVTARMLWATTGDYISVIK